AAAGARARAGVFDDAEEVFVGEVTRYFLSKCFECGHNVEVLSFIMARCDGSPVHHDGRAVEPSHGHDRPRHVFITAGDGDDAIVILTATDGLDAIGNDIAAHQRVPHAVRAVA